MTLKDGVVYIVILIAVLFAIAWGYWAYMYLIRGWGVYALQNAITTGIVAAVLYGLAKMIQREPSESVE